MKEVYNLDGVEVRLGKMSLRKVQEAYKLYNEGKVFEMLAIITGIPANDLENISADCEDIPELVTDFLQKYRKTLTMLDGVWMTLPNIIKEFPVGLTEKVVK